MTEQRATGQSWAQIARRIVDQEHVNARVAMRLTHGLTQTDVARLWNELWPQSADSAGITDKHISYWETWPQSGHEPSLRTLRRLAQLYQCDAGDLIDGGNYSHLDKAKGRPAEAGASLLTGQASSAGPAQPTGSTVVTTKAQAQDNLPGELAPLASAAGQQPGAEHAARPLAPLQRLVQLAQQQQGDSPLEREALYHELVRFLASDPGRRAVLAGGLAGLAAVVGPDLGDRLDWVARHPLRLDMSTVDALAAVLAAQRRAEDSLGSAAMLRPVIAQLSVVEQLTTEARGPLRPALLSVGQQWAQYAGWLCRDGGGRAGACACLAQALEWAAELNDRTMISTVLLSRAYMAAEAGAVGAMIGLAQGAQHDATVATGQRADAAAFEGRGHAMAGDSAAAERKLRDARDLADALARRPQDQRPWLYWLTPAVIADQEGITCAYLAATGRRWHDRAIELLTAQHESGETPLWAEASHLTWLAFAHARANDVGQACSTAVQASEAVRRVGSARHAATVRQISADLHARYPDDPRVAELADALARSQASRPQEAGPLG